MKKVALITGASSGIGKEIARLHAEKTGDLILVARSGDKLNELKAEIEKDHQREVLVIVKDLTNALAPKEIYDEIKEAKIDISFLINNAGFGGQGKFHERKWEDDLAMINLNIIALTTLSRLFLPDFVAKNEGRILNVSSTASLMAGPLQAVYFASKAYVTSFSNALSEELHNTNITVTALLPGATETEFAKVSGMDKTELFANTFSARSVAVDGYHGMMEGKLNVLAGLSFGQKLMMAAVPLTPKKLLLSQVRKMQEVN